MKDQVLSTKINNLFMKEIIKNASNADLSNEEKEAKHVMLSELLSEVQNIVSEHQEKVRNASKDLFDIANKINEIGL